MSMANPPYYDDSAAAVAVVARDRLKKSTMACEMCRKRKVLTTIRHGTYLITGKMYFQR